MEFATEAILARKVLARALDGGVPARWVTADETYGGGYKFRTWLEERSIGYAAAVPRSQTIPITAGCTRAHRLVAQAPPEAWKRLSCVTERKGRGCSTGRWLRCRSTSGPPPRAGAAGYLLAGR